MCLLILNSSRLNHGLDLFLLRLIDERGLTEMALSLARFRREDMAPERLAALEFSGCGSLEAFFRSGI